MLDPFLKNYQNFNLDYLDSLPFRESSTTYLKYNSSIYCDYKESKLIHFNYSYSKFENKLQRACIKFIGKSVDELASYLFSIKTKNKFYKQAIEFVYNCLYNRNSYCNELDYISVVDGIVIHKCKLSYKTKFKLYVENTTPFIW